MLRMQWLAPPGCPPGQCRRRRGPRQGMGSHKGRHGERTNSEGGAAALGSTVAETNANQPERPISNQALLPMCKENGDKSRVNARG